MKIKNTIYTTLVTLLLYAAGCVDKISIGTPDQPPASIMVQGRLVAGTPNVVKAEMFELSFYEGNKQRPINGATILLEDDKGNTAQLDLVGIGEYQRDLDVAGMAIKVGNQYRITAKLPNGTTYQSAWEILQESPIIEGIQVDTLTKRVLTPQGLLADIRHFAFVLDTDLSQFGGSKSRLFWDIHQHYKLTDTLGRLCYCNRPILADLIPILDGTIIPQSRLDAYVLRETPIDYRFAEGYYLEVSQSAISENAIGYFDELNQLLAKRGTLFDPPAGTIRSNFSNIANPDEVVNGFFFTSKPQILRVNISPEAAGYPKTFCPPPPPIRPPDGPPPLTPCGDCRIEPNGTFDKPTWWQ